MTRYMTATVYELVTIAVTLESLGILTDHISCTRCSIDFLVFIYCVFVSFKIPAMRNGSCTNVQGAFAVKPIMKNNIAVNIFIVRIIPVGVYPESTVHEKFICFAFSVVVRIITAVIFRPPAVNIFRAVVNFIFFISYIFMFITAFFPDTNESIPVSSKCIFFRNSRRIHLIFF